MFNKCLIGILFIFVEINIIDAKLKLTLCTYNYHQFYVTNSYVFIKIIDVVRFLILTI